MKHSFELETVKNIAELKHLSKTYFRIHDFKLSLEDVNFMKFKNGSIFRNMFTFNPLKWKSTTKITLDNGFVLVEFDINTAYQMVSQSEEELWLNFVDNYKECLVSAEISRESNLNQLKETKKKSWRYIGFAMLGGMIGTFFGGILAYLASMDIFLIIGASAGAVILLNYKMSQDRSETEK